MSSLNKAWFSLTYWSVYVFIVFAFFLTPTILTILLNLQIVSTNETKPIFAQSEAVWVMNFE